jgi:DNA primase
MGNTNDYRFARITSDTIEEVKDKADIYEVVSRYVALRKRGKEFMGVCPFHKESTPSFSVSQSKQMYYCFGCHEGGDVIRFVKEFHGLPFVDSVSELAREYGVLVRSSSPEYDQELSRKKLLRNSMYEVLESAANFYQNNLSSADGSGAIRYLTEVRGLSIEVTREFKLGYASRSPSDLYDFLTKTKMYPEHAVKASGLISSKGNYDLFRDRIVIPIHDANGRVVAFGARVMGDQTPKYLNSSDSELFSKKDTLFALNIAKDSIKHSDMVIVVEGYFDAIALHSRGVKNVVASLGTALSESQMRIASRYTESGNLVLNFDSDSAGTRSTLRAISEASELTKSGLQLKILQVPGCKDVDEFLKSHDAHDYMAMASDAPHCIQWRIDIISKNVDIANVSKFNWLFRQLSSIVKEITDESMRIFYIPICAKILCNGNYSIHSLLVEKIINEINETPKLLMGIDVDSNKRSQHESNEIMLLKIFIHHPPRRQSILDEINARKIQLTISHHRIIWQQLILLHLADDNQKTTQCSKYLMSKIQSYLDINDIDVPIVYELFFDGDESTSLPHGNNTVAYIINSLDISLAQKKCRYFLNLWKSVDMSIDLGKSENYYNLFSSEKSRVSKLLSTQSSIFSEMLHNRAHASLNSD